MPVARIETTEGPLFWYMQSYLLLHKDRFFAVDTDNYLGELMLAKAVKRNIPLILTYPQVPFCPPRYFLRLQHHTSQSLFLYHQDALTPTCPVAGRSIAFFPTRLQPWDRDYIHNRYNRHNRHAERSSDFLTPKVKMIRNWMKGIARQRIEGKNLALAMGLHPRLGAQSPLLELGIDLLSLLK